MARNDAEKNKIGFVIMSKMIECVPTDLQEMARQEEARSFNYRCPYTDKHCDTWNCSKCKVNAEEERWMRMHEGESRIVTDDVIEKIKADILRYKSDCEMVEDAVECKICNKMMFDSILSIIDKHTKGDNGCD